MADTKASDGGAGDQKSGVTFESLLRKEDVVWALYEGAYRELFMKQLSQPDKAEEPNKQKLPDTPKPAETTGVKEVIDTASKYLSPAILLPDGWSIAPTTKGFIPNGVEVKKTF